LHTLVGFFSYDSFSEEMLWFFTAGMALFYVGALNLIQTKNYQDKLIQRLTIISNMLMTIFVLVFGIYTLQKNLGNPLAWLLILNAMTALLLSIKAKE